MTITHWVITITRWVATPTHQGTGLTHWVAGVTRWGTTIPCRRITPTRAGVQSAEGRGRTAEGRPGNAERGVPCAMCHAPSVKCEGQKAESSPVKSPVYYFTGLLSKFHISAFLFGDFRMSAFQIFSV